MAKNSILPMSSSSPTDTPINTHNVVQPKTECETSSPPSIAVSSSSNIYYNGTVTILDRGPHHVVVAKPPSVVCHHSYYSGSKSKNKEQEPEIPMLQRVRQAVGKRVNLIHRLDRGASGCLLFSIPSQQWPQQQHQQAPNHEFNINFDLDKSDAVVASSGSVISINECQEDNVTSRFIEAHRQGQKTYLALVRGEGVLHGQDLKQQGWFVIDRPLKDESGNNITHDALTWFRFVAGQHNDQGRCPERARACIVLARPVTGRWHQIRKHLNGLSHPILGDSMHGSSQTNKEWRTQRGLPAERICLHLLQMQLPPITIDDNCLLPDGLTVRCPLPLDLWNILQQQLPDALEEAQTILQREEGIMLEPLMDHHQFPQVPFQVLQARKKES